jgi:hypothetical protein
VCGDPFVNPIANEARDDQSYPRDERPGESQLLANSKSGRRAQINIAMIDQHDCLIKVPGQTTPLQQILTCWRLDRGKLKVRISLPFQNEVHRPVAQIAYAVEEDDFPLPDSFVHN